MERIKDKADDLTQKIRPGTTWVSGFTQPGNNDDLRSIDSDGAEMRLIPVSRYYASCKIKRGQAVSIAQLQDLDSELQQNKFAYVKPTDPDLDETCIGIAMNYAEEGSIVQIQSTGKFTYCTKSSILCTDSAKETEVFLDDSNWDFGKVRGQKLYIKKLYNNPTDANRDVTYDENGDAFDTSHLDKAKDVVVDSSDIFTYDFADSIYNAKNTIQIGYLTDAPTTDKHFYIKKENKWYQLIDNKEVPVNRDAVAVTLVDNKIVTDEEVTLTSTGLIVAKGATPPKAHEAIWMQYITTDEKGNKLYSAVDDMTVTLELNVTGDTRGPIDNTQFILTLGETIYFDTEKRDVPLEPPHYNQGIFDEVKVVAIAEGQPTGPCFRVFLTNEMENAYVKVDTFSTGKTYYGRYPGNVFKKFPNLTATMFENTFERAYSWVPNTKFYVFENNAYVEDPTVSVENFESRNTAFFIKIDFYEPTTSLDYAFIALRKLDGDTYIIPVLNDFSLDQLANGSVFADVSDEGYFRLSQQFVGGAAQDFYTKATSFNANTEYFELKDDGFEKVENPVSSGISKYYTYEKRSPKIIVGPSIQKINKDAIKSAVTTALKTIFVDDETRITGCEPVVYDVGDNGFQILTKENGGSYDIYLSSNLLSNITSTQIKHGQSAKAGQAILADIRDSDRLNVAGVVLSNSTGVRKAGETIKVMKLGRLVTLGNLKPGQSYFLGLNGRITTKDQYWYDHTVPIGIADSENYLLVDVCQYPVQNYAGNLPLGYLKPSVHGNCEKGFVMADGITTYNKDEYPELYNFLLGMFSEEELKPSNVSKDKYEKYLTMSNIQIFNDIFMELASLKAFNGKINEAIETNIEQSALIGQLQAKDKAQDDSFEDFQTNLSNYLDEAFDERDKAIAATEDHLDAYEDEQAQRDQKQDKALADYSNAQSIIDQDQDKRIQEAEETEDIEDLKNKTIKDLNDRLNSANDNVNQLNREIEKMQQVIDMLVPDMPSFTIVNNYSGKSIELPEVTNISVSMLQSLSISGFDVNDKKLNSINITAGDEIVSINGTDIIPVKTGNAIIEFKSLAKKTCYLNITVNPAQQATVKIGKIGYADSENKITTQYYADDPNSYVTVSNYRELVCREQKNCTYDSNTGKITFIDSGEASIKFGKAGYLDTVIKFTNVQKLTEPKLQLYFNYANNNTAVSCTKSNSGNAFTFNFNPGWSNGMDTAYINQGLQLKLADASNQYNLTINNLKFIPEYTTEIYGVQSPWRHYISNTLSSNTFEVRAHNSYAVGTTRQDAEPLNIIDLLKMSQPEYSNYQDPNSSINGYTITFNVIATAPTGTQKTYSVTINIPKGA